MKKLTYALATLLLAAGAARADYRPQPIDIHLNRAFATLTAYDQNGVYTIPPQDLPQFGQVARSAQITAALQDIAAALTYVYGIQSSPNLNASLLNSGTLNCARMPALTGAVVTTVGNCATTLSASSVALNTPVVTGTLPDLNLTANVVKYTDSGTNFTGVTPPTIAGNGIATGSSGTYTGTLTGCTTTPTVTVSWVRVGNMVTITIPVVTATSNASTMTITGALPAAEQPVTTQWMAANTIENNTTFASSPAVSVSPGSSTITFSNALTSVGFTASGTKGISSTLSFTYQVAQ